MTGALHYSPIIVGGMGGSGTRVVAKILEESGVFLGSFLNAEYDNLLMPVLAHPGRYHWSYDDLKPYLSLFERLHLRKKLTLNQWLLLMSPLTNKYRRYKQLKLVRYALNYKNTESSPASWGWKNGTNQFFLSQLNCHYPHCFYVHVIRHGLDMAFAKNLRQLERFGAFFGIKESDASSIHSRQLDFWIKTNQATIRYCQGHMPERHFIIRFDELCLFPEKVITELLDKIGIKPIKSIEHLASLVKPPISQGRYLDHDAPVFTHEQVDAVKALGFQVR